MIGNKYRDKKSASAKAMAGRQETRNKDGFTPHLLCGLKKPINPTSKKGAGFTLMELIVVLALFSVIVVIIVDVFLLSMRSQRQTSERQKTLATLRYVVETISRQVKTSEIDYNHLYDLDDKEGIQGSEQELYLKDIDGNNYAYYLSDDDELKVLINGQEASLTNSEEVKVISLAFFINPIISPFLDERCNDSLMPTGCLPTANACTVDEEGNNFKAGFCICDEDSDCLTGRCNVAEWGSDETKAPGLCLPFDLQPRVTIALGLESVATKKEEQKRIYLQTTISSRIYKR